MEKKSQEYKNQEYKNQEYKIGDKVQIIGGTREKWRMGFIRKVWDDNWYSVILSDLKPVEVLAPSIDLRLFPKVICLSGSTRFERAYERAMIEETLAGNIVLSIGVNMRTDPARYMLSDKSDEELTQIKEGLDELHLRKIDMADELLVLNVDGYMGESTSREVQYAKDNNKLIRYLEPLV